MSLKSENQKEAFKFSDPSIQLPPTNKPTLSSKLGSEPTRDQSLFHSMREPLEICSVNQSQGSAYSTERARTFYSMPSLKAPNKFKHQASNWYLLTLTYFINLLQQNSEHIGPFADYIKINPSKHAVVLIEGKIKSKFVLIKDPSELTSEDITAFVESWSNGDATKYGMTD